MVNRASFTSIAYVAVSRKNITGLKYLPEQRLVYVHLHAQESGINTVIPADFLEYTVWSHHNQLEAL